MGLGCTREQERVEAALGGLNEAVPAFVPDQDVKSAGVLFALPALLLNGLLKYANNYLSFPKGYYGLQSFLLLLSFAALLRIKSLEAIRYCEAGELGKAIGLDRIPEIRTLRKKVKYITNHGEPEQWSKELSKYWMEEDPELAGILYVDGHVRVYSGSKTPLPKRYVSRQKLCLRGLTDYWVNDAVGKPFFVVSKAVNSGLLSVMREQIIPRLLRDIPKQPTGEELKANRHLYRFGVVFDREGYSPEFFKEMWEKRIACYTYKKYVNDVWPESEFIEKEVVLNNGEVVKMKLAERGVYFRKQDLWVREIRKLTDTGHQASIITTDFMNNAEVLAARMFSRWSQENFLKYMMEHYGIDRLIEYEQEAISETTKVVNPRYRELESQIKTKTTLLNRQRVKYGALVLKAEGEEPDIRKYVQEKATIRESIDTLEKEIEQLKATKKNTEKHIEFSKLPEDKKFQDLKKSGKQFVDTIKMIAYRAETAMANTLQEYISKKDEARSLVRQIFMTDADIMPDEKNGVLRITIHNMTNPRNNRYVQQLCDVLNSSETLFPGTNLRLVYNLVSNQIPPDQEF